jgi:outer membrane protein TolC
MIAGIEFYKLRGTFPIRVARALALSLLVLPISLHPQTPQPAPELTLDDAVSLALKDNRDVRNARFEIEKSENDVAIARTYRLPTFELNVTEAEFLGQFSFKVPAGAWGVYPATGPIPATQEPITTPAHPFTLVEAKASQQLSRFHGLKMGIRLRELERDEAREKLRAQQSELANQVRKLYYGMMETQSALAANQKSIETLGEQDRVAGERVSRRTALQSEELDVKARIARVGYESANLRHRLAAQKEQLNDLMGRDPATEFTIRPLRDVSTDALDLAAARARALSDRPEIRQAILKIGEAQADREVKKSERIPEVSLEVAYLSPFRIAFLPENIAWAGFSMKWDVFDWGRKKKELANKSIVIEQATLALKGVQSQVSFEVESQYVRVMESQRLLEVIKTAQEAARERVRIADERHTRDATLLQDLMEAQGSLAETDNQYQQALAGYLSARADFEKAAGGQ